MKVVTGVLVLIILILAAQRFWIPGTSVQARDQPATALTERETTAAAPIDKSIAVLPFINRSFGAENTGFFSDGVHGDLLTRLSAVHELKVISHESVMAYRDSAKIRRVIGEELGVSSLLEGGVQLSGDRVRIDVQLINAQTNELLWTESYDRKVSTGDIFEIQGEITHAVANVLQATLSPEEDTALEKIPTGNLEAYRSLLISRQIVSRGEPDSIGRGIKYARKAISLDPQYVDAQLALAYLLIHGIDTGLMTDDEVGADISAAIGTATALQPENDEAWAVLGYYQSSSGKPGAEDSFKKALLLNPGNAQTLYAYGLMLQSIGRPQDALPVLLKSRELDPLSTDVYFALGKTYDALEENEAARGAFARIREIDPISPLGYAPNSGTYISQGRLDEATYWLGKGVAIDPRDFELGGWMVFLNDCLEDYPAAQEWSDWLDGWVTNQPQPMAMQARHHYLTGNFEMALQYSNLALNLGLPNRGGSDGIFMRIKRDEALANGNPEAGIDVFRMQHPNLFRVNPEINPNNMLQAVDLALLLKLSGRLEETRRLLDAVFEVYDQPWSTTGSQRARLVPARAEALAILDDEEGALVELRRIIDKGWRVYWRWETDLNPNFNGIRKREEFLAMVSELEADMAEQRFRTQAMAERGEIAPPPDTERN